jgi:hypothetical protein
MLTNLDNYRLHPFSKIQQTTNIHTYANMKFALSDIITAVYVPSKDISPDSIHYFTYLILSMLPQDLLQ